MRNNEQLLFDVNDPRGYRVVLSKSQYENHIISSDGHQAHNEFTPTEIKACIESPEIIYQSSSVQSRDLYFGRKSASYPGMYIKTVVEMDEQEKSGEVVTAHLTKKLNGGKDDGLRYVSAKFEL